MTHSVTRGRFNINVAPQPTGGGRRLIAVGQTSPKPCGNCADAREAKIRHNGKIITVHCTECTPQAVR